MQKRLLVTIICLHISAVLYVLLSGVILLIARDNFGGMVLAVASSLMAVGAEIVVFGLLRGKLWSWIGGVLLLSVYATSGFFFLGIPGLWGLLSAETRTIFLKGSLEERSTISLKVRTSIITNKVIALFGIVGAIGSIGWFFLHLQQPVSERESTAQVYENKEYGFAIRIPDGWEEQKQPDTVAYFFDSLADEEGEYVYNASINVMVEDASGLDLAQYTELVKQQRSVALEGYTFAFDQEVNGKSREARVLGDSYLISGEGEDTLRVRAHVLIIVEKDTAYLAAGVALASAWEKQKKIIDAALNTFNLGE